MRNRLALLILSISLLPAAAFASIDGTAHQFEFGNVEPDGRSCGSICHSYVEAGADLQEVRGAWLAPLEGEATVGVVASMCGTCHLSGGAYSATMQSAFSDNNVYGLESHGQKMALSDPPVGTDARNSGLPYVGSESGIFQCSTCHDPHDDSYRPFLRGPQSTLCARCHTNRNYVGGIDRSGSQAISGFWQLDLFGGSLNPGSHPVGEDIVQDGNIDVPVTISSLFRVPFSSVPGQWSPGPHLSEGDAGGVVCVTCHAVHGTDPDPDDASFIGISTPPNPSFLAVFQNQERISGYGRPVANGSGDSNQLCEACHGVNNNPDTAYGGVSWADSTHNVNPGKSGTYSHPVDSYPSSLDAAVAQFPEGWPSGSTSVAGENVSPAPICESCHLPHPAAAIQGGRIDVFPEAGSYMLRAPAAANNGTESICGACHEETIAGHHPTGMNFDSSGVFYLQNVRGGAADLLTCSTCHVSAHNWSGPGLAGLDPSWLPLDNGREAIQEDDMYNPDMSKTCMDCHYFMDGDGASISPTLGTAANVALEEEFQTLDRSMGTHYIGLIHEEGEWFQSPLVNIFDTKRTWKEQSSTYANGLGSGWSRFGGSNSRGSRVLVCESCHELEPDKNGGFKHLLLAPYEEGQNGMDEYSGDGDGRDILCEACHGVIRGSHPMTDSIVSRTKEVLNPNADWIRPVILGYATLERSGPAMSCDSCHQPHDANSNSYTYCLDAPDDLGIPDSEPMATGPAGFISGYGELHGNASYLEANGSIGTYVTPKPEEVIFTTLCHQCHDR